MKKTLVELVERDSVSELQAYFADMPAGQPLDSRDEMTLLEHFSPEAIKSYIARFRFSEKAEKVFIEKATSELRRQYINAYGLQEKTERFIVDKDLTDAALDYAYTRGFEDINYLLKYGSAPMIRAHIKENKLNRDSDLVTLLYHENKSLFTSYLSKGHYISDKVKTVIVEEHHYDAFRALTAYYYSMFTKKCRKGFKSYTDLKQNHSKELFLSDNIQLLVLDSEDKRLIEQMR